MWQDLASAAVLAAFLFVVHYIGQNAEAAILSARLCQGVCQ